MKTRIISAAVLLMIFIPILFVGKIPYAILMTVISVVGLYELLNIRGTKKKIPLPMQLIAYLLLIFYIYSNYNFLNLNFYIDCRVITLIMLSYLIPIVFINNNKKYNLNDALFLIGSTLFIGLSFNLLILIRNFDLYYIIYIFGIAALTDTFALLIGRRIGKHKLASDISPNKTIEGAIGGTLMATFICSIFFIEFVNVNANILLIVIITFIFTIVGQTGDLTFSAIKRYYNVKDFSNLIPGHGGILDRFDSVIFVVLSFMLFFSIL